MKTKNVDAKAIIEDYLKLSAQHHKLFENNTYSHSQSSEKIMARNVFLEKIRNTFPKKKFKLLKTTTLGGKTLDLELELIKDYKLNSFSYEKNKNSAYIAEMIKPKGVEVIRDDIFNHSYRGENVIWFDFTSILRYENVNKLISWIITNPIVDNCLFAVTYTTHSRVPNEGWKQVFGTKEKHDKFIFDMINYIGLYLENTSVMVEPNVSITRYKNWDIGSHCMPMIQIIFSLKKKS